MELALRPVKICCLIISAMLPFGTGSVDRATGRHDHANGIVRFLELLTSIHLSASM